MKNAAEGAWHSTATMQALLVNINRDPKKVSPKTAEDFPLLQKVDPQSNGQEIDPAVAEDMRLTQKLAMLPPEKRKIVYEKLKREGRIK